MSRLGYRSVPRRNDRARPDDRYHREPSHGGGRGKRYGKNARASRSCDRDSRERSINRTSGREGKDGTIGERKTKKQYEASKSRNGRDSDNSDRHTPNRSPQSSSRDSSYGKARRNRTSTSASSIHGQNVREVSRERRKSDHRADSCNGSRKPEPREIARNVDEHVVRARREKGNQGSTPSRNDEYRSVESCSSISASLRDSSVGSARHPTTTCKVSSGGSGGNHSAVKNREVGDDPSPIVRSAISSAYDRIPMPTTSLEYNPSSIGVEDLFSSLEDQFPDHAIRRAEANVTPGQSGCRSSLGSTTSETAGDSVTASAMTDVSDSPAPASTAITVAVESVTETSPSASVTAPSGPEQLIEDDEANGGKLVGPISRGLSVPSSQATVASERGGSGEKSGPEAGDMAITNECNMLAESVATTGSSPQKRAGDTQVSTSMEAPRSAEVTSPLLPEEAAEIPSVSEITPASAVATGEAPRVERSSESSPTCVRELEGENGAVVAATVAEESRLSSMVSGGSWEADCSSEGRKTQRLAVAVAQNVAPTDAIGDSTRDREARKDKAKEADGNGERDVMDVGAMAGQEGTEREEEAKEEEKGDRERCDEGGEDVEQQQEEDEGNEKESVTSVGGVKRARKSHRWYRKGTLVVLNCGPDDKPGKPRPFVPTADLLGRPVSVDLRRSCCRTMPWCVLGGHGKERSQMYPISK